MAFGPRRALKLGSRELPADPHSSRGAAVSGTSSVLPFPRAVGVGEGGLAFAGPGSWRERGIRKPGRRWGAQLSSPQRRGDPALSDAAEGTQPGAEPLSLSPLPPRFPWAPASWCPYGTQQGCPELLSNPHHPVKTQSTWALWGSGSLGPACTLSLFRSPQGMSN